MIFIVAIDCPARIHYTCKSIAGRYRPVSYPDGSITARYRFIMNAYWVYLHSDSDNYWLAEQQRFRQHYINEQDGSEPSVYSFIRENISIKYVISTCTSEKTCGNGWILSEEWSGTGWAATNNASFESTHKLTWKKRTLWPASAPAETDEDVRFSLSEKRLSRPHYTCARRQDTRWSHSTWEQPVQAKSTI